LPVANKDLKGIDSKQTNKNVKKSNLDKIINKTT